MNLLILSGLSGAGKSLAVHALEDIGFFCIDNLPPALLGKFIEFSQQAQEPVEKLAVVMDVRGGEDYDGIRDALDELHRSGVEYKTLFLDAQDEVLQRRYKETRRMHPISIRNHLPVEAAIQREREILRPFAVSANYVIDTSILSTAQLRDRVISLFISDQSHGIVVNVISFGFKYGLPKDSDLVFDVRCLPNPFYVPELKKKTGCDAEVYDYVMKFADSVALAEQLKALLKLSMPLYVKEGKSQLTIAVGCTGGKHRSITFARVLADYLVTLGFHPNVQHRDIQRGVGI
ncbi:MAG: RNase adapter RapZ [Pygmaiobacter massiliensis]|nr:RNase adapter RapZ [Pygmaiobacter massiliensis]